MAAIDCLDIFDAVYSNTKRSFLQKFDTVKVKSKTFEKSSAEEESLNKPTLSEPVTVTEINNSSVEDSGTETVKESVERVKESDAAIQIRKEIEEKFPYALASACSELEHLDKAYRNLVSDEPQGEFSHYYIDITDTFPLSERFVFPCIMYVSSMMLIDVDEKKSDTFFAKYADCVSSISSQIPFEAEKIAEKYPY